MDIHEEYSKWVEKDKYHRERMKPIYKRMIWMQDEITRLNKIIQQKNEVIEKLMKDKGDEEGSLV